jgi:hypothetical protein
MTGYTLRPPPGRRLSELPRSVGDKPQETFVAVNPRNPSNVVVSYHRAVGPGSDHHPDVRVELQVASSSDGGRTWNIADCTHPDYRVSIDAAVAFDLQGHAFVIFIGMDEMSLGTRHGEYVRRSVDGGRTWAAPVALAERPGGEGRRFEHMPKIVADNSRSSPHAGALYAIWDRILADHTSEMVFARSSDSGTTWSEPRVIASSADRLAHASAVGPDGTIYVLYTGESTFESMLVISHDGGGAFEAPLFVMRSSRFGPTVDFPRAFTWPVIGVDGAGTLYVAWTDYRNGDSDVFATSSHDRGRTWRPPTRVNDDPVANGKDQVMHWFAVDPEDGDAYVLFYDRRNDPGNVCAGVTLARSRDGAQTFENYAADDRSSDPRGRCLGDYIGIAALAGRVYGAWTGDVPTEEGAAELGVVTSGDLTLVDAAWPSGPTAIRVGVALFRDGDVREGVGRG